MDKEALLKKIAQTAVHEGGITVNPVTCDLIVAVDEWLFPMYPELTAVVPEKRLVGALAEFLAKHRDKYQNNDAYLGIWHKDGHYYIDLNAHAETLDEATKLARRYSERSKRDIISAYNPATDQTHYF